MNPLIIAIIASIVAMFVVACGLKLIDIGSSLANPIIKYGPVIACILGVVAAFNFLLIDTLELVIVENVALIGALSFVAFCLLRFTFDIIRGCLLIPKRAKSRKSGRVSKLSVAGIFGLDFISGIIAGAVAGVSFSLNIGTGIIVVISLMMLILGNRINLIKRYQAARLSRKENIIALVLTLVAFPLCAITVCIYARKLYSVTGVFLAVAFGYLLYISLFKAVEIVKKLRKS